MRIVIAHAAWLEERKQTLDRLLKQLAFPDVEVLTSRRREHASVWAHRAWEWAEGCIGQWVCVLNDDVLLCPDFVGAVERMADAIPDQILSLHNNVPGSEDVPGSWIRTYSLTGPAYVLPPGVPTQILDYAAGLPQVFTQRFNEDNIANHWAWEHQRPMYAPVVSPVQHDTMVKSSLGYDNHADRSAKLTWLDQPLRDPAKDTEKPPFLESWAKTSWLAAVRKGLRYERPCQMCWQREATNGNGGVNCCRECLIGALTGGGQLCGWCAKRPGIRGSQVTGISICGLCLHETSGSIISSYETAVLKQQEAEAKRVARVTPKGEIRGHD